MIVFAIDPGNKYSGVVVLNSQDYSLCWFGKYENSEALEKLRGHLREQPDTKVVIENISCYGMPVGR